MCQRSRAANEMRILKYLIRYITVLNLVLLAVIVIWALHIVSPHHVVVAQPPAVKKPEVVKTEPPAQSTVPSPLDYTVIAEQNLFHPDRKIPVEKPAVPPLPKPEFVLYGTLITDETGIAYMDDKKAPYNTPGRGKRQTTLKKGESLSGFFLKEVAPDKVVMVRGEETMVVNLTDTNSPKTREFVAQPAPPPPPPPGAQPAAAVPFQATTAQQARPGVHRQPAQQGQQPSVAFPAASTATPQRAVGTSQPNTTGGLFSNIFKR